MTPPDLARAFERLSGTAGSRNGLLAGFAVGLAGALTAGALLRRRERRDGVAAREAALDRAVEGTFPASDPPALDGGREDEEER